MATGAFQAGDAFLDHESRTASIVRGTRIEVPPKDRAPPLANPSPWDRFQDFIPVRDPLMKNFEAEIDGQKYDVSATDAAAAVIKVRTMAAARLSQHTLEIYWSAAMLATIPPAVVLGFGLILFWIMKGFRRDVAT